MNEIAPEVTVFIEKLKGIAAKVLNAFYDQNFMKIYFLTLYSFQRNYSYFFYIIVERVLLILPSLNGWYFAYVNLKYEIELGVLVILKKKTGKRK